METKTYAHTNQEKVRTVILISDKENEDKEYYQY